MKTELTHNNKHLLILGAGGTFMAGVAQLAQAMNYTVVAVDENIYPPMSTMLEQAGIELIAGYGNFATHYLAAGVYNSDNSIAVIGNALSRGNIAVEYILNHKMIYMSGPQWLFEYVLKSRIVLAVSGTHGKTTTSSMLAWILACAGYEPGYLIGGVPQNFNQSACLGGGEYFVLEADEYDSAFFDKRSKFIHYHPDILVINNIEFDHADIFNSITDIQKQFHYLIRTVPNNGQIIYNQQDNNIGQVLDQGIWTPQRNFGLNNNSLDWSAKLVADDASHFSIYHQKQLQGEIDWSLSGEHNVYNALAAIAASYAVSVKPKSAISALEKFSGVKRRQEKIAEVGSVAIYEDFAHHPTAIKSTLDGFINRYLKNNHNSINSKTNPRLIVILELASNTMRSGYHDEALIAELARADQSYIYFSQKKTVTTNTDKLLATINQYPTDTIALFQDIDQLVAHAVGVISSNDIVLLMSNGSFANIYQKLPEQLATKRALL